MLSLRGFVLGLVQFASAMRKGTNISTNGSNTRHQLLIVLKNGSRRTGIRQLLQRLPSQLSDDHILFVSHRAEIISCDFIIKSLISFIRALPSVHHHLLKGLPPLTINLRVSSVVHDLGDQTFSSQQLFRLQPVIQSRLQDQKEDCM